MYWASKKSFSNYMNKTNWDNLEAVLERSNITRKNSGLKGQCHKIFDFRYFLSCNVFPGPLVIPFPMCLKLREDIFNSKCTTAPAAN
jgi:hypothetical protein